MKKKINYILGIFLFSTLFFSCENNMEEVVVTPDNGPENVAVDTDIPLICTADNAKDTVFVISWSAADFGKDISSTYTLQLPLSQYCRGSWSGRHPDNNCSGWLPRLQNT